MGICVLSHNGRYMLAATAETQLWEPWDMQASWPALDMLCPLWACDALRSKSGRIGRNQTAERLPEP